MKTQNIVIALAICLSFSANAKESSKTKTDRKPDSVQNLDETCETILRDILESCGLVTKKA